MSHLRTWTRNLKLFNILKRHKRFLSSKSDIVINSKYPSIKIPNLTLSELFWERSIQWPDRIAVTCGDTGKSLTYNEMFKKSKKISAFLQTKLKLKKGDAVGIILPNTVEYGVILFGAVDAGLTVTTINPHYTKDEISKQIKDSEVTTLFVLDNVVDTVKDAIKNCNKIIPIISVNIQPSKSSSSGTINYDEIMSSPSYDFTPVPCEMDDVALLLYSSGTTGLPKGVQLTHRNIVSNVLQSTIEDLNVFGHFEKTVVSNTMAFFHSGGMNTLLSTWYNGSTIVALPSISTEKFRKHFVDHKPNVSCYTPLVIQMVTNNPNFTTKILEPLKIIHAAGAPLGNEDIVRFKEKTRGEIRIIQGYGLTEASPVTHRTPLGNETEKNSTVGVIVPNTDMKIVAVNGDDKKGLPVGEFGEILIKGPQVMKGYFKNPKATMETITEDGWLHTGDLGHFDEDGYLFVTDRLKELIKVKGFQVAPAELEEVLRGHPVIHEVAVVGTKHEKFGEVPKAIVVLKRGEKASEQDIKNYVADKVINYKRLEGGVIFTDALPKSSTGKILRKELKNI